VPPVGRKVGYLRGQKTSMPAAHDRANQLYSLHVALDRLHFGAPVTPPVKVPGLAQFQQSIAKNAQPAVPVSVPFDK
jgi:hypothetical protein